MEVTGVSPSSRTEHNSSVLNCYREGKAEKGTANNSLNDENVAEITADACHILATKRRCQVIQLLRNRPERHLSEIADIITANEHNKEPANITSSERNSVYATLYQCHVPKLNKHDVVETGPRKHLIKRGENYALFADILTTAESIVRGDA